LAKISGEAVAGDFTIEIVLSDGMFEAKQAFELNVKAKPVFASEPETLALINKEYNYEVSVGYNHETAVEFSIDTDWLSLTNNGDNTATITGTPANAGDYTITIIAQGEVETAQEFTLTVGAIPVFVAINDQYFNEGEAIELAVETTYQGVNALAITGETGNLTLTDNGDGTAVIAGEAVTGQYKLKLMVNDGMYQDSLEFSLVVGAVPVFVSTPVGEAFKYEEYVYNIVVDYTGEDQLVIEDIVLPEWLSLTDNGNGTAILSGTPEKTGVETIVIRAIGEYNEAIQSFDLDILTGLNETALIDAKVYPNPASEVLYFVQSNALDTEISIVDLSGKVIETVSQASYKIAINVDYLQAGMYMLVAKNAEGVFNQQIVVE
jgi:acylphosphatase